MKRITPASIKGEYEITPINCQWSELTNAVLKDKFEQHLKDNQKYRYWLPFNCCYSILQP